VQGLMLVAIQSLRQGHYELWRKAMGEPEDGEAGEE